MRRRGKALPPAWVQPHRLTAGGDDRVVPVGTVEGGVLATVDRRGLVVPATGGWALDWWIGAEDGWHLPSQEPVSRVRQARVEGAPVVETSMRVPGGEVVHRAYGARGDADAMVVEVENRSHVPVALALSIRPYDAGRVATLRRVGLDGSRVTVDGEAVIELGRAPAFAAAPVGGVDVADLVQAGLQDDPASVGEQRARDGLLSLAAVFPLPHTAVLRVTIGSDDPTALPAADAVVRGWRAHAQRGMRVVVPDEALQAAIDEAVCTLLLGADERAFDDRHVVAALERWGFADEVARMADGRGFRLEAGDAFVVDRIDVAPLAPERVGSIETAHGAAEILLAARSALVGDAANGERRMALWPVVPDAWLGQGVEVHDAPTPFGPLSFAVRWHGARPAVLWHAPPLVTVHAPGLDPTWSSDELKGEALLAPVAPPGGLPKVYGAVDVGRGTDDPGDSFS
jgi:hypothetical protein